MTETKQTMRAHLRQHGLPEAWAEWVSEIRIERRDQVESFTFTVRREDVVTVRRPQRPQLSTPGGAPRTDDEMVRLWAEYGDAIHKWRAAYGDADTAEVVTMPEPHYYRMTIRGTDGIQLRCTAGDPSGPWWCEHVPAWGSPHIGADGKIDPKPAPRPVPPKPPVFISGPFRGPSHWDIAQNIRRAEAVALAAWRSGLFSWVYCPHANTAHFQDAAPDEVWIEGHLEAMRAVHREGGVVLVVPDWEMSKGTRAEIDEAFRIGMPVFEAARFGDDVLTATKAGRITRSLGQVEWVEWKATLAAYLTERAGRGK